MQASQERHETVRSADYDVCMLLQNSFRNDARVLNEARSLAQRGYRLKLLALRDADQPEMERVQGFDVHRVHLWSRVLRARWHMGFKLLEFVLRLTVHAVRSNADVYHAHHPVCLLPAVIAARWNRGKVVYDLHELNFELPRQTRMQSIVMKRYERALLPCTDAVITSDGESRGRLFQSTYGYEGPMHYLFNYAMERAPDFEAKDLHAALKLDRSCALVMYSGMIGSDRGMDVAIESMAHWPSDAHFVMIGMRTATEEQRLNALADAQGVRPRIHFFGPVPADEVTAWMTNARVSLVLIQDVALSYRYSTPTKMFESIVARIPQVASDLPEIRKVVRENPVGPVGEVVTPDDPTQIGTAIHALLLDETKHSVYRSNADELARTRYNWQVQEPTLDRIYADLLGASSKDFTVA